MDKNTFDILIKDYGATRFELKEEHIKLLRSVFIRWEDCEFGAPAIDCKRPYGNSAVYEDIGDILNIVPEDHDNARYHVFSEKQKEIMDKLHGETETALQIILSLGTFEIGVYESPDYHSTTWRKVIE